MGQASYVAFKTDTGFDLHYSHLGGREYLLREVLLAMVREDIPRETLLHLHAPVAGETQALKAALSQASSMALETEHGLISQDPEETGVPKCDIFTEIPAFDTEVVYIVEESNVRVFIPVNPSVEALDTLVSHSESELYRYKNTQQVGWLLQHLNDIEGVTVEEIEAHATEGTQLPDWALKTFKRSHRYFISGFQTALKAQDAPEKPRTQKPDLGINADPLTEPHQTSRETKVVLENRVIDTKLSTDVTPSDVTIPDSGIPVEVSWNNGVPKYPTYYERGQYGAEPKIDASKHRYVEWHNSKSTSSKRDETRQVIEDIKRKYENHIPREYLPAKFLG